MKLNRRGRKRLEAAGRRGVRTKISGPEMQAIVIRLRPANH